MSSWTCFVLGFQPSLSNSHELNCVLFYSSVEFFSPMWCSLKMKLWQIIRLRRGSHVSLPSQPLLTPFSDILVSWHSEKFAVTSHVESWQRLDALVPWFWASRPPKQPEIRSCSLSHLDHSILFWQHELIQQPSCHDTALRGEAHISKLMKANVRLWLMTQASHGS